MRSLTSCYIRRLTPIEKSELYKKTGSKYKWVTEGEAICRKDDIEIRIPHSFLTDGSSGGPDAGDAWLFHDWLYSTHQICGKPCSRKEADILMIEILKFQRFFIYAKVVKLLFKLNPFGVFSNAWENSGKRGPQFKI